MTVDFFKEKYGYEIEGAWLPRVTAIIALSSTPYFAKGAGSGEARAHLLRAAEWGSISHETIGKILKGERFEVEAKIAISIDAFLHWRKENPIRIADPEQDIEKRVFDMDNGYAGTLDFVAKVQGVVGIIDLKTSTQIRKEFALQTAAYMNAYNKNNGSTYRCEKRWILRLDQYQECVGCLAKRREKYGSAKTTGGNPLCNHQWSPSKGEVEFREMDNYEKDLDAFLELKERWEVKNKDWLSKIPNYPKNIRQRVLL